MAAIHLDKLSTRAPRNLNKERTKLRTAACIEKISALQDKLYASKEWALLIILQGLDASGKDGAVKTVFSSVNPQGIKVKSFKAPTEEELDHDFLWRVHRYTPGRGMIRVFNRSHYEDVLSPQVEGRLSKSVLAQRIRHINHFEQLLTENRTRIVKFYLHISAEEQRQRLDERLRTPSKQWKYDPSDQVTADNYEAYCQVYEDIFRQCGKVPWHIIPADQNWYKQYLIAKTILEELQSLKLRYPSRSAG